ncbi:MAG: PP2C family protein-serine/threonine phosphatase [Ignavibacteriae bacterium]|nr:PP2C family protein-serine/threonine phosphatase [Ignavibacteriota bacterium]
MEQRRLSKTIEKFLTDAPGIETVEELLSYVLKQIIDTGDIGITGGRIWKLKDNKTTYILIEQTGDVSIIDEKYELKVRDFSVLKEIGKRRTITSTETDRYLKKKGIYHYSATGVGHRYKIKKEKEIYFLYQYLIALNGNELDDEFIYTLNIIGTTINSILRTKRIEFKAKENIAELEKASEIQNSILPEHSMKFGNYELYGISIPDKIVGGDFFDYIKTADDYKLCVAIGDAASKGISAAAQSLYVSGALKMGVDYDVNMPSLIRKIGNLVNDTFPDERFVTLFLCELYTDQKGLFVYVNAGHNLPFYFDRSENTLESLLTTGSVLGPSPDQKYYTDSFYIEEGDIVVLYTDGIVEAMDADFELYGEERLRKVIMDNSDQSPEILSQKIIQDVQVYSANGKYSDDKTLVIIKRIS